MTTAAIAYRSAAHFRIAKHGGIGHGLVALDGAGAHHLGDPE